MKGMLMHRCFTHCAESRLRMGIIMTKTGKLYADSLYELALETKDEGLQLTDRFYEELKTIYDAFSENPDYVRLLSEPSIARRERLSLIDKAFGGAHEYILNFLKLLCDNGLLGELGGCFEEFRRRYFEDNNIASAKVTSAAALSDSQIDALRQVLEKRYGKTVMLKLNIDPAIIGGLKVEIDGQQLDGSLKSRLDKLRQRISGEGI